MFGVAILAPIGIGILYFIVGSWDKVLRGIVGGTIAMVIAALVILGLYLVTGGADDNDGDDQCL